jgi:hypothetical protein
MPERGDTATPSVVVPNKFFLSSLCVSLSLALSLPFSFQLSERAYEKDIKLQNSVGDGRSPTFPRQSRNMQIQF